MKRLIWMLVLAPILASRAAAAPAKDEQAEAQTILDQAIKAVGGKEKLAKLTLFTVKSHCTFSSAEGWIGDQIVELSCDLPRRLHFQSILDLERAKGTVESFRRESVIDGDQGWTSFNLKLTEMTDEQIAFEKDMLQASLLMDLAVLRIPLFKATDYKLTSLGESKIGDRRAMGINVSRKGQSDIQLYFDKDTGLPLKRSWLRKAPPTPKNPSPKAVKVEVLFDDYKDAGGVKYPAKRTTFENDREARVEEITELKIVEKFDAKTFAKPE